MWPAIASITGRGIREAPALFRWMTLAQPGVSARHFSRCGSRTPACYRAEALNPERSEGSPAEARGGSFASLRIKGMPVAMIRGKEDLWLIVMMRCGTHCEVTGIN